MNKALINMKYCINKLIFNRIIIYINLKDKHFAIFMKLQKYELIMF